MRIFITFPSYFLSIIETYLSFPSKEIFFNRYLNSIKNETWKTWMYCPRSSVIKVIKEPPHYLIMTESANKGIPFENHSA